MRFIVIFILCFSLIACKHYPFAKKGHFVDGVDAYFNLGQNINIWLYYSYLNYNGGQGLRLDSLYPKDKYIFDLVGLKGKEVDVLFTAKPENYLNYHLAVLHHKRNHYDVTRYERYQGKDFHYYYRDFEDSFLVIRHVLIPYAKNKWISMVYYVDKDRHMKDNFKQFNYLAAINAKELQEGLGFRNTWQVFDCQLNQKANVDLKIRQDLTKKNKIVYLKISAIYEETQGISFLKILTQKDADRLAIALCPNTYLMEYSTQSHEVLLRDTLSIGD